MLGRPIARRFDDRRASGTGWLGWLGWLVLAALGSVAGCRKDHAEPITSHVDASAPAMGSAARDPDAGEPSSAADAGTSESTAVRVSPAGCAIAKGGKFVAEEDRALTFVRGSERWPEVNRTPLGALPPSFVPADLVDVASGAAGDATYCEQHLCLRRDAREALQELLSAMGTAKLAGHVESAYRSYRTQCATFKHWAEKSDLCAAAEQSALPGHSQHQLGTAVDLFTQSWRDESPDGPFRNGFGCSKGGAFLRDQAFQFGFVLPYPIHPDDRHPSRTCDVRVSGPPLTVHPLTGYKPEAWHLRFIGKAEALAFHTASEADPELTLDAWLHRSEGRREPVIVLPVCDGCNCGACATLSLHGPCGLRALLVDERGNVRVGTEAPSLQGEARVELTDRGRAFRIATSIRVPAQTLTQPPVVEPSLIYTPPSAIDGSIEALPGAKPRTFSALPRTWRVAISVDRGVTFPWAFALTTRSEARTYNRANVVLPAEVGDLAFAARVRAPEGGSVSDVRVKLVDAPARPDGH